MRIRSVTRTAVIFEAGLGVLAIALAFVFGIDLFGEFSFNMEVLGLSILAVFPLLFLMWVVVHTPWKPFVRILQELERTALPWLAECSFGELVLISIAAGFGEEALFRGLIQAMLSNSLGLWAGLIIASFLFGLAHLVTPAYGMLAGLIGVYFGLLFVLSGNLLLPISTHALYDLIALTYLMGRRPRRGEKHDPQSF